MDFRQYLVVDKTIRTCISMSGLICLLHWSHFFAYNKKSKTKVVSHNNGNNLYSQCPRHSPRYCIIILGDCVIVDYYNCS